MPLLAKYRHKYRVFNDDIQGTGCVTLAGLVSATRSAGSSLAEARILCAGAGSAGLGVCSQILDGQRHVHPISSSPSADAKLPSYAAAGMVAAGLSREDAQQRFCVLSKEGAFGRRDGHHGDPHYPNMITEHTAPWVNEDVSDGCTMLEAIKTFKPTVLLGLSASGGIFTEDVIRTLGQQCERPIIMPMSNPTSKAECTPRQAYEWTDGRAVVATGSPFGPVNLPDGRSLTPSQCNNMYVFPGLGLAASVAGVTEITDRMLYEAAIAIPKSMTEGEIKEGRTFPNIKRIREVSHAVACAVIKEALREGKTTKMTPAMCANLPEYVSRKMYYPAYVPLVHTSVSR